MNEESRSYLARPPTQPTAVGLFSWGHGVYHARIMAWLVNCCIATPSTQAADNTTTILGETSEPQPDGVLIIEPAAFVQQLQERRATS